jgi:hypothetical protein
MAEKGRRRQKAVCAICAKPIAEGEAVRRITLESASDPLPSHETCYERDWERIEGGLEPFPMDLGHAS